MKNAVEKLSVIVPTRTNYSGLARCLRAISDAELEVRDHFEIETIVLCPKVDGTIMDILEGRLGLDHLDVVEAEHWWALSRILNRGVGESSGERILILHDDAEIQKDLLLQIHHFKKVSPGITGFLNVTSNKTVLQCGYSISSNFRPMPIGFNTPVEWFNPPAKIIPMQAAPLSCMTFPRKVWDDAAGLDPEYQFGWEDVDFCLRAGAKGHRVNICTATYYVHDGGGSAETKASYFPIANDTHNRSVFHKKWIKNNRIVEVLNATGSPQQSADL